MSHISVMPQAGLYQSAMILCIVVIIGVKAFNRSNARARQCFGDRGNRGIDRPVRTCPRSLASTSPIKQITVNNLPELIDAIRAGKIQHGDQIHVQLIETHQDGSNHEVNHFGRIENFPQDDISCVVPRHVRSKDFERYLKNQEAMLARLHAGDRSKIRTDMNIMFFNNNLIQIDTSQITGSKTYTCIRADAQIKRVQVIPKKPN